MSNARRSAMPPVAWADVEREARAGDPVEVFRHYERRHTDEHCRDRARAITVSVDSFARHLRLSRDQFRVQVRAAALGGRRGERAPVPMPKPPTDEVIRRWLTNRDRDADDPVERERAVVELAAAEAERMAALADLDRPNTTRASGWTGRSAPIERASANA